MILFFKGFLIGILASAPMGPAGLICIRRTLQKGRLAGLFSGIGIMTADVIFGIIAGFGLESIRQLVTTYENIITFILALILVIVGAKIWRENLIKKIRDPHKATKSTYWNYAMSMFALTINPINILPLFFLCALFQVSMSVGNLSTYVLIPGIACGAFLWWCSMSILFSHFRKKIRLRHLFWINRVAGMLLVFIGAILIGIALWKIITIE